MIDVLQPNDLLPMWVVYDRPTDYPDRIVAQLFENDRPTNICIFADSLREIRQELSPGRICIPRLSRDPLAVVETWL